MLDKGGIPPKEQRILAPSTVDVEHNGGYSTQCVCTLRVTDVVNLAVYYVPLTPGMVTQLRTALAQHDSTAQPTTTEQDY
jgi:hypothetical protein